MSARRRADPGRPVVLKVGSSGLVLPSGGLDDDAVRDVIAEVVELWEAGYPTVLVTSGAVAAGWPVLGYDRRPTDLASLQVAAAVGQGRLMERYMAGFALHGRVAGQVLLTKDVLADRDQYLHARVALERMLATGVIPVVNENDTVAVEELRLGDNDRLAALVSHLVGAGMLVLLTDTEGVYDVDPRLDANAELLSAVRHTDEILDRVAHGKPSPMGSGGMATKVAAARMAAYSGVPTIIAKSRDPGIVTRAVAGDQIGTWVEPQPRRLPSRKLWLAFGQPSEGFLHVDPGAVRALVRSGGSLLPVGITDVEGEFRAGAAVEVLDVDRVPVAKGLVTLSARQIRPIMGRHSSEAGVPGWGGEVIHRDDMVVLAVRP